jgi:hypothetical protein
VSPPTPPLPGEAHDGRGRGNVAAMYSGRDRWADAGDRWSWRLPVVLLLVLVTMVSTSVAVTLGWARSTLIDTDGYVSTLVEPLTDDPAVKDAVATELAAEMTRNMGSDITARLAQYVPADAFVVRQAMDQWGAQIEQSWREGLRPAIRHQLDEPTFTALWIEANREAHRQLVDALRDSGTGATVTLDLHDIAVAAVRETGVQLDRQLGLPGNIGTLAYNYFAEALPPETGQIAVDVSRISSRARTALTVIDPLYIASLGVAAFFALVALGVAPRRRRGTAVIMLGVGALIVAGGLWMAVSTQSVGVGERVSSVAVRPLSPEMRLVVDREAELAVESFRLWAAGTAAAGVALVLVGGVWRIISGRATPEPVPATTGEWAYPPSTWSSRTY